MPTPAAPLLDQAAIMSNAWIMTAVVIGAMSTFAAVAIGWKLGRKVLAAGIAMFNR